MSVFGSTSSTPLRLVFTLSTLTSLAGGCLENQDVSPRGLQIAVAPLSLPGIGFACYDLRVQNDLEQTVWSRGTAATFPTDTTTVCSSSFGNTEGGDITYIGPCDATEADSTDGKTALNRVTVWVDGLYDDAGADIGDYRNPCAWPDGCELSFECTENEDVLVTFDLTIMRSANQGFFDIGVNFEDVFCSAKADTCYPGDPATPIELLGHSGRAGATDADADGRYRTGVSALACTAGPGAESTVLRMSAVEIVCAGGNTCSLAPAAALPGNNFATCSGGARVAYAVYRGVEQLACDGGPAGSCQKLYWNLSVNLEDLAAAGFSDCTLRYDATAATATAPTFSATNPGVLVGPSVTYPVISFASPLLTGTMPACGAHPLDADEVVTTGYLQGCDESPGAPACTVPALCNTLANQGGVAIPTSCGAAPVNNAPVVANGLSNGSATTDQYFELTVASNTFSDPDGDALTLTASIGGAALPAWLSFDGGTGVLQGTPSSDDVGTLEVSVTATDPAGASVSTTFTIDIVQPNQAPVADPSDVQITMLAGATVTLDLADYVTDPDGDTLYVTNYNGVDFWSFNDLVVTLMPTVDHGGNTFYGYIEVWDGFESTGVFLTVTVDFPNRAPVFQYGSVYGTKQSTFTYDLTQAFSDPDGDILTFTFGPDYGPFPTGTIINGNTLTIDPSSTGTSTEGGEYWYINVIATDPGGLVAPPPSEFSPNLIYVNASY